MLVWDTEEAHNRAKQAFEKWKGFHNDAIESTSLKPRTEAHVRSTFSLLIYITFRYDPGLTSPCKKKKAKTVAIEDQEWREKYGEAGQKVIRKCVDANTPDYEYLKSFAIKG